MKGAWTIAPDVGWRELEKVVAALERESSGSDEDIASLRDLLSQSLCQGPPMDYRDGKLRAAIPSKKYPQPQEQIDAVLNMIGRFDEILVMQARLINRLRWPLHYWHVLNIRHQIQTSLGMVPSMDGANVHAALAQLDEYCAWRREAFPISSVPFTPSGMQSTDEHILLT